MKTQRRTMMTLDLFLRFAFNFFVVFLTMACIAGVGVFVFAVIETWGWKVTLAITIILLVAAGLMTAFGLGGSGR